MRGKFWLTLGLCLSGAWVQAQSTFSYQVAYYMPAYGQRSAYLMDWHHIPSDWGWEHGWSRLVDKDGVATGQWELDFQGRIMSLDLPRVLDGGTHYDSCGQNAPVRITQTRFMFKETGGFSGRGQTDVSIEQQATVSEGCDAGKVLWASNLGDAPTSHNHLEMRLRKGVDDVVAGARLAGLSEAVRIDATTIRQAPQDIARFDPKRSVVHFERSGSQVPFTKGDTGWLRLNFPWGQRALTRLAVDENKGEAWLMADLQDGETKWVEKVLAVKVRRSASLGSLADAAREWVAGYTMHQPEALYLQRLFLDGTGERGTWNSLTDVGAFSPLTWRFEGVNLVQRMPYASTDYRLRTWEPLRTAGTLQWVMEEDIVYPASGTPWYFVPRRLHPQLDRGPAQASSKTKRRSAATPTAPVADAPRSSLRQPLAPSPQARPW